MPSRVVASVVAAAGMAAWAFFVHAFGRWSQ